LDHSYGSVSIIVRILSRVPATNRLQLIEAEMNKEVKKPPVIEFMIPKRIFTKAPPESGESDSLLVSLWDFGSS
jgi:hypothetical protein